MDPWIRDPRSKITEKTSWIQGLDPRSKIPGKTSWIQDPRFQKKFLDPRSGCKIQNPRFQEKLLGPGKALSSDPRSFCCNLGFWIQINCYASIVLINVYKRLEICHNPPFLEKGFREGPNYWKIPVKMAEGRSHGGGYHIYIYVHIYA